LHLGRWILSRLDVLSPSEIFRSGDDEADETPGITQGRDFIKISFHDGNRGLKKRFLSLARQMSQKAIRHIPIFEHNGIQSLDHILPVKVAQLSQPRIDKIHAEVLLRQKQLNVSVNRIKDFERMASEFLQKRGDDREEMRWAVVSILINRYAKRTPQASLFSDDDPEPSKPLEVDSSVYEGARIHLFHNHEVPYYYGFEALSDAASENAETFMSFCAYVVEAAENLLIKQKPAILGPKQQHGLIVQRAVNIVDSWSFPQAEKVKNICHFIATRSLARSLEANAPLGHGANAYGIPQQLFNALSEKHPDFANILKFGVAYSALSLVQNYPCKGKDWCLLELGGPFIVRAGLSFRKGGFVEGNVQEIITALQDR